jgi:hypothetical protein
MKSYKCPQCGIVGLATSTHCKSCHAPNPHPVNALETYTRPIPAATAAPTHQTPPPASYQAQQPSYQENSYNSPPPPTMYGDEYGTAYGTMSSRREHPISRFRTASAADYSVEMEAAEADIRKAWKAGRAWCFLVGLIGGLLTVVLLIAAPSPFMILPFLILLPLFALIGGLSYGVFKKSRACAVILLCITGLGLLSNLLSLPSNGGRGAISIIISILFCYYFALGVRGTFKYHKLMQA